MLLLSPSLNQKVSTLNQEIMLPERARSRPTPDRVHRPPRRDPTSYAATLTANVTPTIPTENVVLQRHDQASAALQVYSVVRTIVPSSNGVPQVEDTVTLRNLASYYDHSLPLTLLAQQELRT